MLCLAVLGSTVAAMAQLTVIAVERLPLDPSGEWSQPRFSPDGSRIYVTTTEYRGIWEFDLATATARRITDDPGSGYAFSVSDDGTLLAYRRTLGAGKDRSQEIVVRRLDETEGRVVAAERKLSVPAFSGDRLVYREQPSLEKPAAPGAATVTLLGIDQTNIALLVSGKERVLDPLGTGRYVWPSLSPERTRIAAVQMERGALVSDLEGNLLALLGRCNAPSWTHDGRWIVGMDDRDDGYKVIASDLVFVSPDGMHTGRLTATEDVMEMFPDCSPVDNRIAYATLAGQIYVLTYQEEGR